MAPYGIGMVQDAISMFKDIQEHGYTIEDVKNYVSKTIQDYKNLSNTMRMESEAQKAVYSSTSQICPNCGKIMLIFDVNTTNRNKIGGTAKSMWQCEDILGCGYEIESELSRMEEFEKMGMPKVVAPLYPIPSLSRRRNKYYRAAKQDHR